MKILWQSRLQNRLRDIGENVLIKGDHAFYVGDNDEQKRMKLRKFSLASGERGALLAVGGLLGVYFGTSQAYRARRETQKKWLLVLYVVLFALALKKVLHISASSDFAALRFALASVLLQARFKRLRAVLLRRPFASRNFLLCRPLTLRAFGLRLAAPRKTSRE